MEFVIITGLSGAGKSRAAEFLEDAGFFTVDNIPPEFMPKFVEFCLHGNGQYDRVALVSDIRSGSSFVPMLEALDQLDAMKCNYRLLFMEAELPALIRRYKETRRLHPLAKTGTSLEEAVARERELLQPVRDRASDVLDTTPFSSTQMLRGALRRLFGSGENKNGISVTVMSFGYKYGMPLEADLVFDMRFLPNPYYVTSLRELTGKDAAIRSYLDGFPVTREFQSKLLDMISFLLPCYAEEGKPMLTVAIGCTGGRHRSVAMACYLTEQLRALGYTVSEYHRDVTRA
ncbi:MAG: RNase adapter RapZ [Oscillospiraceae bacterium]|nr:RNase adapter RapZ [Oscillospiraceae bacterium]